MARHDGMWAEVRARYLFRTYDVNEDGSLDAEELVHFIRHR